MSHQFDNKGYGDYFDALERQLNKPSEPVDTEAQTPRAKSKKRKGLYKVVRLRKSVLALILIVAVGLSAIVISGGRKGSKHDAPIQITDQNVNTEKKPQKLKISYSFTDDTLDIPASNDAKNVIIIDKSTNKVIAARNATEKAYPASTTKIMTLLVAVEHITDLSDTFTMTLDITDPLFVAEASVAQFLNNETITMEDMLYGLILPSGADAAIGLAIKIAGSEENFVKLMNDKVRELGLKNTHFTNTTGLHDEDNYSTAYDMAVILDAALRNSMCKKVLSTYQYTTSITPQHPEGILLSSTLFSYMYGTEPKTATILGGKTGFVNESGYCIASYGENNENKSEYIVVTLGNSSRWPAFYGQIDLYKEFVK